MASPRAAHETIRELGRKRLEKFAALVPRLVVSGDSQLVHDARVWSRRTQEVLRVLTSAGKKSGKQRKLERALRAIRQAFGRPRNLDVSLLMVDARLAKTKNPIARDAWERLRLELAERRDRAVKRAGETLAGFDVVDFATRCRALIDDASEEQPIEESLKESVAAALDQWRSAIDSANADSGVDELHTLRIAGKRLRYRLELLAAKGDARARKRVQSLRALQDQLGSWHDSEVFLTTCAKFLRRQELLARYPGAARALLSEMERERRRIDASTEGLVKHAQTVAEEFLDAASPRDCGQMHGQLRIQQ